MEYASTTTLNRIRAAKPCENGWAKLLRHVGKTAADDDPLPLLTVLDGNGFGDALWVLSHAMPDDRLARHFQAWCAEQVVGLFEAQFPGNTLVRDQIAVLRRDDATPEDRAAARAAAWAFRASTAWANAGAAARCAAVTAMRDHTWLAARSAAAADHAYAAAITGEYAEAYAAWAATWAAEEAQLRKMLGPQQREGK